MTVAELIGLMQNEAASIDMQFQMWMAVTFAVIIANYTTRSHLSLKLKVFVASMYALTCCVLMVRYANDASQFIFLNMELSSRGVEYPSVGDLRLLRGLVYIIGTVATIVFVFVYSRSQDE